MARAPDIGGRVSMRAPERFDMILCDVMMPQMTGIDFYRELEQLAPDQASAVVFLTGGAFTEAASSFLGSVSNPRIDKPFRRDELRALARERVA